MSEFQKGMNDNKKLVQLLRSEFATLEHKATEANNDAMKDLFETIANME